MQYSCCRPVVEYDAVSMSGSVVLSGIVIYEASAPNTRMMCILAWVRPGIYIRHDPADALALHRPFRSLQIDWLTHIFVVTAAGLLHFQKWTVCFPPVSSCSCTEAEGKARYQATVAYRASSLGKMCINPPGLQLLTPPPPF